MKRRAPFPVQGFSGGHPKRRRAASPRRLRSHAAAISAQQSSLPPPQPEPQQQQADEDTLMTDVPSAFPFRPSPYVNPNWLAEEPQNSPKTSHNNTTTTNHNADLCRHPGPVLWDDPERADASQLLVEKGYKKPKNPIATHLPPLHDIEEIFGVAVEKALDQGLEEPLNYLGRKSIRVATMCSGTESPLLALDLISQALQQKRGIKLNIDHVFSAEIVPFKQAYIERNFHPNIIFRDMRELIGNSEATTAYGNKVPIPSQVDILVTGTSCVDFSRLNRWNKGLDDGGESGQTFFAFIDYIAQYRPAICILENVQLAPWRDIVALLTNDLGKASSKIQEAYKNIWKADDKAYAAEFAKIDTKNYYIPHTRQRGYLIAIDRRRFDDADKAVKVWAQKLKDLQQRASSPAECFLMDNVARLNETQASALHGKKTRTEFDWSLCFARNQNLREEIDIGSQRPLTQWVSGGSCKGPDHWDFDWIRCQPERTWDAIDICHLRNAKRGFDDTHKTRYLEVTQNVDRELDAHGTGLVSCLTPAGSKFITTQGRRLMGQEALLLQGIPIHKLHLTHETQRELFDLAGNAMTTTVVGTALLAALIAGHRAISIDCRPSLPDNTLPMSIEEMNSEELLPEQTMNLTEYERCTLDELLSEASASARLCLCEGQTLIHGRSFKKCNLCGHTACEKCAGMPRHDYCALSETRRLEPTSFIRWLTNHLPMRLHLANLDISCMEILYDRCKGHSTPESAADWKKYKGAVKKALGEDMRFASVTRSRHWIVRYDAPHSYLQLVVGETPYWRIFVKPERQLPNNSRLRWLLKDPIARMRLNPGYDFLAGKWEFNLPVFLQCSLKIEGFGSMTDSWESHLGIQIKAPAVEKVYTKLKITVAKPICRHIARSIEDVEGEYELLEDCGTASRSLHRRIGHSKGPSMYFFLDTQRVGPPEYDRFVFSRDHHRLSFGETRDVVGSIDPKWRQGRVVARGKGNRVTAECRLYGLWVACGATLQVFESGSGPTYAVPRRDLSINISPGTTLTSNTDGESRVCSADTITFVSWKVPLMEPDNVCWRLGPWRQVDQESEALSLRNLTWLFQKSKDLHQFPSEWRSLSVPDGLTSCQSCSPETPSVKWRQVGLKKVTVVPYEDERQAGIFERALKARKRPFIMQTRAQADKSGGFIGYLRVGINITVLAHRVLSKVPSGAAETMELSWRLNTAYEWPSEVNSYKFTLRNNNHEVEKTFVFLDHSGPGEPIELGRLRKEQRRSLRWMKKQESVGAPTFLEQEIEEAYLPTLGWLAETMVKFPSHARGGVLADEVGYGKTATTLALIAATMEKASVLSEDTQTSEKGIPTQATLIIVSPILVAQWESQIAKFLGKDYPVVKIVNVADLNQVDVHQIKKTSIVLLSWQMLNNPVYHQRLGAFAAMPECSSWNGRPYRTWLEQAVKRSDDHAKELHSCEDVEEFERILEERSLLAGQNDDAAIPFKRPLSKMSSLKPFKLEQESKLQHLKSPPINLFRFHRIVIDEYTYLEEQHVDAISFLRAPNRWVLSGTPKLTDFADVKLLAKLIKVNLGVDHDASIPLQTSSTAKNQNSRTAAEKFRSYVEEHSPQWHAHRVKHAQEFLHHFARRNTAETDEIQTTEILKPVVLSWMERALVMELQQQLYTQEIRLCRGSSNKNDGDRVKRMKNLVRGMKSPEEALLKACFSSVSETSTYGSQNHFDSIMDLRETEYQLVRDELKTNLRHAEWLQRQLNRLQLDDKQLSLCHRLKHDSEDCDPEGSVDLKELFVDAETGYKFAHQDEFYRDKPGQETAKKDAEQKRRKNAANKAAKAATKKAKAPTKKLRCTSSALRQSAKESDHVQNLVSGGQESGSTSDADKPISESAICDDDEIGSSLEPLDSRPCKIDLENGFMINEAFKKILKHVGKLRTELLSRRRALRFLHTAQTFHIWQCDVGPTPTCLSCGAVAKDPSCIFVLALCGHVCCQKCLEDRRCVERCVVDGCSSTVESQHVHPAKAFKSANQPNSSHGTKLDSIISCIKAVDANDQILLFVQFQTVLKAVCKALEASGITYYAISDGGTKGAARMVHDFQENESEEKKQVLILNPSNETAAGLNLVNANHVMFVSPLLCESAHEFHESRTQCIGRARRYGQTKTVHVYDFLALNTVDVDITEDQQCKRLVQESPGNGEEAWRLKSEEEMTCDEKTKIWGSGWERKIFFDE